MNRQYFINSFVFYDNFSGYAHIDSICRLNLNPIISDRQADLAFYSKSAFLQFINHAWLISGLQQSRAKGRVNPNGRIDNMGCNAFDILIIHSSCSSLYLN